ncbi:hypothetical protein [Roseibium sp. TrichSKD4]|uniref:hypothetical protein n=1 Tax=Roseibium sp. TrichSKD4 TaxID=744980 RepID=UPI00030AC714|nr:hypothetical protein [Roseibium sp. TrichSKD4]
MSSPAEKPSLSSDPSIHPDALVLDCELGYWTEVGAFTEMRQSSMDDYSYIVQGGDVVWTTIGNSAPLPETCG